MQACKACQRGECENSPDACRDRTFCACCGDVELVDDDEESLDWVGA